MHKTPITLLRTKRTNISDRKTYPRGIFLITPNRDLGSSWFRNLRLHFLKKG